MDEETPDERLTDSEEQLDRLGHLDRPHRGAQDAQDATLRARRNGPRRRGVGEDAAVTRPVLGPPDRDLTVETVDRAPHVRLAEQHAGVADEVARGEVVRAVEDDVVVAEDLERVRGVQPHVVTDHGHVGVDAGDRLGRRLGLEPPHVGVAVDDLSLQVARLHDVRVDNPQGADPRRREVEQRRRAEPTGAHDEHLRRGEPLLALHADLGQQDMTGVTGDGVATELVASRSEGRQCHGTTVPPVGEGLRA